MTESQKRQRPAATGRNVETEQQSNPEHKLAQFWRLVGAATRHPRTTAADVAVLWAVLERVGTGGVAWPGLGRLASDTGRDRATVTRSIKRLVSLGYLVRESGGPGRTNRYRPGRCEGAPRCTDAPRRKDAPGAAAPIGSHAPQVGAGMRLGVGAGMRLESASLNQLQESGKRARAKSTPEPIDVPPWLPADAWQSWLDHRKAVGRKFTPHAQGLAIGRLDSLRREGHDPRKLIELAIVSGWASFNPRTETLAKQHHAGHIERDARCEAEIDAENWRQLERHGLGVPS